MSNNKFLRKDSQIKNLIKEKLKAKITISSISKELNVSRSTIYKIKNGYVNKKSGTKLSYDEKKLKYQVERAIKAIENRKEKVLARKILPLLTEKISLRTLQSYLKKNDSFILRNVKQKIILTEDQMSTRVQICKGWFTEKINFEKVIFSDECRFSLDGPDNFLSWQLWSSNNQQFRRRRAFGGGSIMIYGFIGNDGFLSIKRIEGNLNGEKYASLLNDIVIPELQIRYGTDIIYQHDNARPHISKSVLKLFETRKIQLLNWPPYSPDINIIENVWRLLKDIVYDGDVIQNKNQVWERIENAVLEINRKEPSPIVNMYTNYIQRILELIQRNGTIS